MLHTVPYPVLQVPEYGRSLEESSILENSFQIIFAFDEIVALGYRESVNLAQINTFIQMDSHEEKVAIALREVSKYISFIHEVCFSLICDDLTKDRLENREGVKLNKVTERVSY